jgi:hypothetical protein
MVLICRWQRRRRYASFLRAGLDELASAIGVSDAVLVS